MESGYIVPIAIGVIVIAAIVWYVSTMNLFARLVVKIRESDSDIGVALTKRYDTLTKMLDATKGYAKHEAERLAEIVKLRKGMSMGERGEANRQMDELAGRINVLAESYPDLKASENFKQLQFSIVEVEEHLQAARRIYNMNVSQFNQLLVSWPSSMVGSIHKHAPKDFFEVEERKREDVRMTF